MDAAAKKKVNISQLKRLAEKHTTEELNACFLDAAEGKPNSCLSADPVDSVDILAQASYVSELKDGGMSTDQAIGDLLKKMRRAGELLQEAATNG